MGISTKIFYLGLGVFFLWLTITVPNIPDLFLMDLSNLDTQQLTLLQYTFMVGYVGSMLKMAVS